MMFKRYAECSIMLAAAALGGYYWYLKHKRFTLPAGVTSAPVVEESTRTAPPMCESSQDQNQQHPSPSRTDPSLEELVRNVDKWMMDHPRDIDVWVCKRIFNAWGSTRFWHRIWVTTPMGCVTFDTLSNAYGPRLMGGWIPRLDEIDHIFPDPLVLLIAEYADSWAEFTPCWVRTTVQNLATNWTKFGAWGLKQSAWLQAYHRTLKDDPC
jgi:hypothetical protein